MLCSMGPLFCAPAWRVSDITSQLWWLICDVADKYGLGKKLEKGKIEGNIEVARNLKAAGVATDLIMQATGLSREEIETLH
jgi:hypothetical protein